MWENKFSRRTFLKATAGGAAALGASNVFAMRDWLPVAEAAPVKKVASLCGSCSAWCGMWIYVKNGRIWKAVGQKDNPNSRGRLCARGHAAIHIAYHKDRITHPMKRVSDNEYTPITWEQAYSEISAKLKDLLAKYGPEPMFYTENPKPTSSFYWKRFMASIGCPTTTTHHSICFNARTAANDYTIGPLATADMGNAKFVLFLGRNYAEGLSPANTAGLAGAYERGAKIVIVDPRQSAACILAHEWIPIRPGTDLAFLMAMAHVLIKENLYDKDFIAKHGLGFEEFAAEMAKWTPEWAASVSGIPAGTIVRLAREMAAQKPKACIEQGYKAPNGSNYANGVDTFRMLAMVNGLLGNYGEKGGMNWPTGPKIGALDKAKYPEPPKPAAKRCDGMGIKGEHPLGPVGAGSIPTIIQKAMEGKIKAGFIYSMNPVRNCCGLEYAQEAYKKLDLLVVTDIQWSETARCADYVLPEMTWLEREDLPAAISGGKPGIAMRCQAIDVIHNETKHCADIVTELAQYVGVGKYFNFTREAVGAAILKPTGLTLDDLRTKGTIMFDAPPAAPLAFKTPSKKLQFASKEYAEHGYNAVPTWNPPLSIATKNTFVLTSGKQAIMSHSFSQNHLYVAQIARKYGLERLWINADRAKRLGIKDGDMIEVASSVATRRIQAKVTERIHPETVWLPLGYGCVSPWQENGYGFGVNPNDFSEFRIDPISGTALLMEVVVQVRKVGE